jgi:hypothetical protein
MPERIPPETTSAVTTMKPRCQSTAGMPLAMAWKCAPESSANPTLRASTA